MPVIGRDVRHSKSALGSPSSMPVIGRDVRRSDSAKKEIHIQALEVFFRDNVL